MAYSKIYQYKVLEEHVYLLNPGDKVSENDHAQMFSY